ncbi:hypothetical protein BSK56_00085 [Paenibacillus borealis]|uniref:Lipoprotein n=1 Tax=Paenibacillus borealis TaxID=160799 RepID=A0ABX3HUD9_PAEBO|nr:hypothetical protein [Paenibacillus borealis]OMD53584.1 hypothetical protein BSK56_00085 [Paenibacillus borealis]
MFKLLACLPLVLVLLLAGCESTDGGNGSTTQSAALLQRPGHLMPEVMPEDFAFSVRFGITGKNEINTFEGTVTKDLVTQGEATADLTFTGSEMADIYTRLRDIDVMGELKLEPEPARQNCNQTPYDEEHWQIRLNGEEQTLEWSEEKCEVTEDAKKLKEIRSYIFELVKTKAEYLELPEAVGGYD